MKSRDWNLCCEYTSFECAEFPNIWWDVYTTNDGKKGILLNMLDDNDNIIKTVRCEICNSYNEFAKSFWDNMKKLF